MKESKLRGEMVKRLRPLCAFAVENPAHDGTPDVCCTAGWIELKIAERPKRQTSRVIVEMRPAQRIWHRRWRSHGGRSWTATLLEETLVLHDGIWSAQSLGFVDELTLLKHALRVFTLGEMSRDDFAKLLIQQFLKPMEKV